MGSSCATLRVPPLQVFLYIIPAVETKKHSAFDTISFLLMLLTRYKNSKELGFNMVYLENTGISLKVSGPSRFKWYG